MLFDIAGEAQIDEVVEGRMRLLGATFPSFKDPNKQIPMPKPEDFPKHDKLDFQKDDKLDRKGTFKGFKLMEVSNLAEQARNDANIGLWAKQNDPDCIDDLAERFLANDFDICEYPPIVDENDNLIEGRTRSLAADQIGATLIPVAIYEWEPRVTEKGKFNAKFDVNKNRPYQKLQGMKDYVSFGYTHWRKGWLSEHYEDIFDWVTNESGASSQFSFISGNLTKIAKDIEKKIKHAKAGEIQNKIEHVDIWNKWIVDNLGLDDNEYALINTGNDSYAERAVIRNLFKNPCSKIVFYTSAEYYSDSKEHLFKTITKLEMVHRKCLKYAADHFNSHIVKIDTNSIKAKYEIIGHIPQNSGYHEKYIKENKLVPIEEY